MWPLVVRVRVSSFTLMELLLDIFVTAVWVGTGAVILLIALWMLITGIRKF